MKRIIIILLLIITSISYSQTPHISGEIFIDVKSGRIDCDLTLINIPDIHNTSFLLNKGLNLQFIKANNTTIDYDFEYGLSKVKAAPFADAFLFEPIMDSITSDTKFRLKYTGTFPTYISSSEDKRHYDDQVTIAFKNDVLRASSWTKWYPWLYNRNTNRLISKVTYDLIIKTGGKANTIYINGSLPQTTNELNVKSDLPYDLFLYVGKYDFSNVNNTYFLNSEFTDIQKEGIDSTLRAVNEYYNSILNRKDQTSLFLANIFKIGPEDQYEPEWALAEYPAIVAELDKLPNKLNNKTGFIEDSETFKIYAHEMAHKYWGIEVKANNDFWGFYSESFAEYFGLLAMQEILGKEKYKKFVTEKYLTDRAMKFNVTQLTDVEKPLNVYYCYNYYSMVLLGLEQVVGKKKVIKFFNYLLKHTKSSNIDFDYFEIMALESGISEKKWKQFKSEYIETTNCLELVKNRL
jgi:hypothetical protein